jgi:hypothetical protein
MTSGEKPAALSGTSSFSEVVDEACEQLMDRQIKYSIRRIQEMGERLTSLELELNEFLLQKDGEFTKKHPSPTAISKVLPAQTSRVQDLE